MSLFQRVENQLGCEDGGEAGAGRLRVPDAFGYVRQKLITERGKPIFMFVLCTHTLLAPCLFAGAVIAGSLSLLSLSSNKV